MKNIFRESFVLTTEKDALWTDSGTTAKGFMSLYKEQGVFWVRIYIEGTDDSEVDISKCAGELDFALLWFRNTWRIIREAELRKTPVNYPFFLQFR